MRSKVPEFLLQTFFYSLFYGLYICSDVPLSVRIYRSTKIHFFFPRASSITPTTIITLPGITNAMAYMISNPAKLVLTPITPMIVMIIPRPSNSIPKDFLLIFINFTHFVNLIVVCVFCV